MTDFTSLMDLTATDWLQALELSESEIPDIVIVEGTWWREQRTRWRLGYLSDVRELKFPDIFWGRWQDKTVAFCVAYGAARTVEIIHLFGILGTKLAIQIGTCGGLQSHLRPGHIILPQVAICREGVAHIYGAFDSVLGSAEWIERAQLLLTERGHQTHTGTHLTWSTLFGQDGNMVETWHRAGYLSVDMETATTFAVAGYYQVPAVSMLVIWDDLTRNRSFLDPLTEEELAALNRSNEAVFEVALELAVQL
jgi:purine-nucleoside phosphorylase